MTKKQQSSLPFADCNIDTQNTAKSYNICAQRSLAKIFVVFFSVQERERNHGDTRLASQERAAVGRPDGPAEAVPQLTLVCRFIVLEERGNPQTS